MFPRVLAGCKTVEARSMLVVCLCGLFSSVDNLKGVSCHLKTLLDRFGHQSLV